MSALSTSPEIDQIATALAKAQGLAKHPKKTKTAKVQMKSGEKYQYNYADLVDVLDALKEPFAANGLAVIQMPYVDRSNPDVTCIGVITRLIHASGQWIEGSLAMPVADAKPQSIGSAITYGRRYMLAPLGGIAADEDDDANLAQGEPAKTESKKPPHKTLGPFTPPSPKKATSIDDSEPPPPSDRYAPSKHVRDAKNELLEIPFGESPQAVYTEHPTQKPLLERAAKRFKITHPVHLQQISKGVTGVLVDHLDAAVKEWMHEFGDQLGPTAPGNP